MIVLLTNADKGEVPERTRFEVASFASSNPASCKWLEYVEAVYI